MLPRTEKSFEPETEQPYQLDETRKLVALVKEATELVRIKGETAFTDFEIPNSRWCKDETYIFVLDDRGNMLVHPDPELKNKNVLDLKDINGKPIIRGIINAATAIPDKLEGWYHYQWPVPGGLLPRWKSTYSRLVTSPSGKHYIVGCGLYNDLMERPFAVDAVKAAVAEIEKRGAAAFNLFYDPAGPFLAKDEYIFVYDFNGVCLALPGFPNLVGHNLINLRDSNGKLHIREMIETAKNRGSGWVEYTLPRPGENVSTPKAAYITKVKMDDQWVMVGAGIYLTEAPKEVPTIKTMTAPELMTFVREGAAILEKQGEKAYSEFRKKGSKWFHDDIYIFAFTTDGTRVFHPVEPETEGRNDRELKDITGRPIVQLILDAVKTPSGEGWAHYLYTEPDRLFPIWKSSFLKLVTFPSGIPHIVGCGIYKMQMDKAFIEDVVNRAAKLVAERGKEAFTLLRDKKGPFVFMDTYVFVDTPEGIELVNPLFPSIEGKNLIDLKDVKGKTVMRDYVTAALKDNSAWVDYHWYKPGTNKPARKKAFVRKVQSGKDTFIVGSGFTVED